MDKTDGNCFGRSDRVSELKNNNSAIIMNDVNDNNEEDFPAPIGPYDIYYKMDHKYRGVLLIFNHETFKENTKQPSRAGTDEDVKKIKETFGDIGFEINCFKDMMLAEIQKVIQEYVKVDFYHKQRDCLAIFVLTHGSENTLWAKDTCYDPAEELWGKFSSDKCPSLAGKPKLAFVQACQGNKFDKGIKLVYNKEVRTEFDGKFNTLHYSLPTKADFLVYYATTEGYFAFRNDVTGSFWVTVLCTELKNHYKEHDLLSILTLVNARMSLEFASSNYKDPTKSGMKQAPYFKSSLTRLLRFIEK